LMDYFAGVTLTVTVTELLIDPLIPVTVTV
jgi:hypothetical protein